MYNVTYNERESTAWRRRVHDLGETQKRRIYRWGTHWGILEGDRWRTESRRPQATDWEPGLVEECKILADAHIVPMEVDDLWEEEYISLTKGAGVLEYNGLVSLRGEARTVLEMAAQQGLPTPALSSPTPPPAVPMTREETKRHQGYQQRRPQRRCLIRD